MHISYKSKENVNKCFQIAKSFWYGGEKTSYLCLCHSHPSVVCLWSHGKLVEVMERSWNLITEILYKSCGPSLTFVSRYEVSSTHLKKYYKRVLAYWFDNLYSNCSWGKIQIYRRLLMLRTLISQSSWYLKVKSRSRFFLYITKQIYSWSKSEINGSCKIHLNVFHSLSLKVVVAYMHACTLTKTYNYFHLDLKAG